MSQGAQPMRGASNKEKRWLLSGFIALSIVTGTAAVVMQLLLPLYALSLKIRDGGIGLLRGVAALGRSSKGESERSEQGGHLPALPKNLC